LIFVFVARFRRNGDKSVTGGVADLSFNDVIRPRFVSATRPFERIRSVERTRYDQINRRDRNKRAERVAAGVSISLGNGRNNLSHEFLTTSAKVLQRKIKIF
jgi:hypothetical protein